jgi:hypothetical protein
MDNLVTLENQAHSKIHLIGGEKGGVGKSMMARLLAQYLIDQNMPMVGFDTDRSHGTLMRYYAGYASPVLVDRFEALDKIVESAVEQPGRRVLVDLAAQTHAPLVKWMDESGVLDLSDLNGLQLVYWHVMDAGRDSVDLLTKLLDQFGHRLNYVLVRNQLRGDDFSQLEKSGAQARAVSFGAKVITLRHLHDAVAQKIDAANASFWAARNGSGAEGANLGLMERQRFKLWLSHAMGQIESVGA